MRENTLVREAWAELIFSHGWFPGLFRIALLRPPWQTFPMVVMWHELILVAVLIWMAAGFYLAILKKITGNVYVAVFVLLSVAYGLTMPPAI
ncbi:MAG: hypothetical protein ABTQ31_17305 [Rhizobiaceae bacterium]